MRGRSERYRVRMFDSLTPTLLLSAAAAKDDDKGVAGGVERAGDRAEDEPHPWYACRALRSTVCAQMAHVARLITGITSEGYSGKGFVTTK